MGPLTLPLSLAVGVAAVRGRRPAGGLCAVALASVFAGWAFRAPAPPRSGGGPTLNVVTLNAARSHGRERAVAEYLGRTLADVVVLQEASNARAYSGTGPLSEARSYSSLATALVGTGDYQARTDTASGPLGVSRQITLSRHPIVSYETGYLGSAEVHSGVYSRATVLWEGREVDVYNVHLRPFNPTVGWELARALSPAVWAETPENLRAFFREQSAEALALSQTIGDLARPTVVAGDFNATPDQWSRALLARRADLREVTGRWTPAATRPSGRPIANVDGILVSPGWAVLEAGVGPGGLSDHRPVSARLALPRARP